jgi:hypothetical protein
MTNDMFVKSRLPSKMIVTILSTPSRDSRFIGANDNTKKLSLIMKLINIHQAKTNLSKRKHYLYFMSNEIKRNRH